MSKPATRRLCRLIINADDFGLTMGVNRAVIEAHRQGIVTSSTLMANSAAFDGAVEAAKSAPKLGVGCHVVLVDGSPLLPADRVSSLIVGRGRHYFNFMDGIVGFASRALREKLRASEVTAEALAQMQKIQAAGIHPTHFDTHKHTHMIPQILRPLLKAAKECGIRAVRNPFVPIRALAFAHLMRRPKLWIRSSQLRTLQRFAARFRSEVEAAGLRTTDGTFGVLVTGALDEMLFEAIVGSIPEGTWEFVCHPGYNDADLGGINTRLRSSRESELRVLTSPAAQSLLQRHGIDLITYSEL